MTFAKRKHGLLKKAAELSILCGLKVSLVFSDIQSQNYHVFANDSGYKVDYDQFLRDNMVKEKSTFFEYSIFDYPFDNIGNHESKVVVDPESSVMVIDSSMVKQSDKNKKDILKKREPKRGELKKEMVKPQVPILITFDADNNSESDRKLKNVETQQINISSQEVIRIPRYKFLGLPQISSGHALVAEAFLRDLDQRLSLIAEDQTKKDKLESMTILLILAKQFLLRFFGFSEKSHLVEDHTTVLLRTNIDINSMINALLLIKESALSGNYQVKLSQFCDLIAMVLTNPSGYEASSFCTLRCGKSIANVYIFFIKSVLQQIRVLDSLYSGDHNENALTRDLINPNIIRYAEDIIASVFNLIAYRRFKNGRLNLRKPTLLVASEVTPQESIPIPEFKPFSLFGLPTDKFSERDRKL